MKKKVFTTAVALLGLCAIIFAQEKIGVKIGETTWATRNVGTPNVFVDNPEDRGMLFQWNSKIGWSNTNPIAPSNETSVWNESWDGGNVEKWETVNCPCPAGWRVPTMEEVEELITIGGVWTTEPANGYRFGIGENSIFLPAATSRTKTGTLVGGIDIDGFTFGDYWCSTNTDKGGAYRFYFMSNNNNVYYTYSYNPYSSAYNIRCVKEEDIDTEINSVLVNTENTTIIGYVDMLGRKLKEEPSTGIYIIQYSDGTTKKILK
jgi:uncharacterized protein (TIGR02145 family)